MSKPYQKFTFKNGLRLVTVPMKNTQAVTVLVLVGAGSKYETKKINGISHFLEHMFFKGTKKRPKTIDIAGTLDKIGGGFNAFTDKEYTGYWAKVDGRHLDLAIDWVSDIFLNSKIETKEIEKERGVIIEEINMYLDEPMNYIEWLWESLLYGDQPAGWDVAGTKEVIKNIGRDDFISYLNGHYSSHNTVIAIAGNIGRARELENKIKRYFGKINTGRPKSKVMVLEKQDKPQILIHEKKTDQAHLYIGFRAFDMFHQDRYILEVLGAILGGGMSSRMWISVREQRGLAYYVRSSDMLYSDSGYYATQAGVDNNRVEDAIKVILDEYRLIRNKKVGLKELRKAKDMIKGRVILSMESSSVQARFYADQELFENKILTLEQIFAKIEAVTTEDIQRVARDIFKTEKLNLALIGPFKDKSRFEKLLKL